MNNMKLLHNDLEVLHKNKHTTSWGIFDMERVKLRIMRIKMRII